jgi:sugar-specific transcriptional regulator TrmB
MIETSLQKIGLTKGEIRVYLSLLELGASSTGKIIKKSGISGSKVYEVLDRLAKKGLINSTIKNGVRYFESANPKRILEYLNEKEQEIGKEKEEINKIIPSLMLKLQHAPKSEVKIYTGWEGMKTVNEDIISTLKKGEEWLEMGLSRQPKPWEVYFNKKQKIRARKGIIHKGIINIQYQELYKARRKLPHTSYRFLPKDFEMPISTEIYKNKVAIFILLEENPTVIVIESEPVAESFRKYFYALWKSVK